MDDKAKLTESLAGPQQVGPYRAESRLGQGGMGEVWSGYDDRLDRPVALKRIRSSKEVDPEARDRLRREARAVARLRHPAVAQAYDWVESEDGDWIVMELVEGVSLRHLLRQGVLESGRAIRLALDILAGLAVAHAAGIVHRDLKAENVMVASDSTPGKGEQAKILDFGIAKRFDPDTGESISVDGPVMGTLVAMSPEQIRGHKVDPRSDLFSLGSLLYEMVTGIAPFRSETPAETLRRICTWEPEEANLKNPKVSSNLSCFINRLLTKDPRLRPQSAEDAFRDLKEILQSLDRSEDTWRQTIEDMETLEPAHFLEPSEINAQGESSPGNQESSLGGFAKRLQTRNVLGLVGTTLALFTILALLWQREPPTLYIAVPVTSTQGTAEAIPGQDLELLASAVQTALLQGLLGFRQVVALQPSSEDRGKDLLQLAKGMAADEVLESRLECGELSCRLTLQRVQGGDGRLLWTQGFSLEDDQLLEISQAVVDHLRSAYSERSLRPGIPELQVRAEDYEAFLVLKRRFENRDEGLDLDQVLSELAVLQRSSPRFLDLLLFEAHVLVRDFQETRDSANLERAKLATERAASLAPADPRVIFRQAHVARTAGDLGGAEHFLADLRRLEPGNVRGMYQQARLLERKGHADEALDLMQQVLVRLPSANYYFDFAGMLSRAGRIDAARGALEEGLAVAPDHYNGLSRLAQLELMSGSPGRAVELYSQLLVRSREATELTNLGTAYLLTGDFRAAAENFHEALGQSPGSAAALLNLADAELLSGRSAEATQWYSQVLMAIDEDPEPEQWRTVRAQALAHLERVPESIAMIQEALRAAPDDPMTAYEASLVFSLVGDEASALWNAKRALEQGVDLRWFGFPWFDSIRQQI